MTYKGDGRKVTILRRKMYGGIYFARLQGKFTSELYIYRCQIKATGGDVEISEAARMAPLEPQPMYLPNEEVA